MSFPIHVLDEMGAHRYERIKSYTRAEWWAQNLAWAADGLGLDATMALMVERHGRGALLASMGGGEVALDEPRWRLPVGNDEHPAGDWYISVKHDETGALNGGYRHTGVDISMRTLGDTDRGEPVFAITSGVVHSVGYQGGKGWLGVVVLKHVHRGAPLYVRYAHLSGEIGLPNAGEQIEAGALLGVLGDYLGGDTGDHLHHDMRTEPFAWNTWFTGDAGGWVDPLEVYSHHVRAEQLSAITKPRW